MPPLPRLKQLREAAFLSQGDLAEKAGVGRATVQRVEAGDSASFSTARKLARALGVEPQGLVSDGRD